MSRHATLRFALASGYGPIRRSDGAWAIETPK